METKLCTKCGQVKPVSEFGLNKSKKDGLQCHCKECVKVYKKQHYEDNKQYYKDKAVAYRQAGREYLNDYKSHLVCSKCGEDRWWLLDFHHINPSEKDCEVSKLIDAPNKLRKELEKCIVLCANCHRHLHYTLTHQELIE